jgi:hypothetical protein
MREDSSYIKEIDLNDKDSVVGTGDDSIEDAMPFASKKQAISARSKLKKWGFGDDSDIIIISDDDFVEKTITLTKEQLACLISTLECTHRRCSEYGSFGDRDTNYDHYSIEKVIRQLK